MYRNSPALDILADWRPYFYSVLCISTIAWGIFLSNHTTEMTNIQTSVYVPFSFDTPPSLLLASGVLLSTPSISVVVSVSGPV